MRDSREGVHEKSQLPEFADLNFEWDFEAKAWDAEFVSGPLVGTTRHLTVADLKIEQRCVKLKAEGCVEGHPPRLWQYC